MEFNYDFFGNYANGDTVEITEPVMGGFFIKEYGTVTGITKRGTLRIKYHNTGRVKIIDCSKVKKQ